MLISNLRFCSKVLRGSSLCRSNQILKSIRTSGGFTYTRLSSKSDIQDQSGHPEEPRPTERLSDPPLTHPPCTINLQSSPVLPTRISFKIQYRNKRGDTRVILFFSFLFTHPWIPYLENNGSPGDWWRKNFGRKWKKITFFIHILSK